MNHKTSMYCMIHTIPTDSGFQIIMCYSYLKANKIVFLPNYTLANPN